MVLSGHEMINTIIISHQRPLPTWYLHLSIVSYALGGPHRVLTLATVLLATDGFWGR